MAIFIIFLIIIIVIIITITIIIIIIIIVTVYSELFYLAAIHLGKHVKLIMTNYN